MIWPFRKKEPSPMPEWQEWTPLSNLLEELLRAGWPSGEIIWAIRVAELWQELEAHIPMTITWVGEKPASTSAPDEVGNTSVTPARRLRVTKPRNQRKRGTTKPKRNRAKYMRAYRANRLKPRLVTRNGGLVTDDGDAA
jgi:hypothetical protein